MKARRHADLAARFSMLSSRITERGERDFTEDDINRWGGELHTLEASEPPTLPALVQLCQNQLAWAAGQPERIVSVRWWRRVSAYF